MKKRLSYFTVLLGFLLCTAHASALQGFDKAQEKKIRDFIRTSAKAYQLDEKALLKSFQNVKKRDEIIKSISNPSEGLPWYRYKKIFLKQSRIDKGIAFWKKHRKALERAEQTYGVPAEVIVAILGIETRYGERQGNIPVLDALTTLGFAYPPRAKFFRKELAQYLILSKEQQFDPADVKGSYAGAIGQPQFMPSSYRHFAVDFNKKGRSDLINSPEDAIGSVANYLMKNGWKKNEPVILDAQVSNDQYKKLQQKGNKPNFTLSKLKRHGVHPTSHIKHKQRKKFVWLALPESETEYGYWLGTQNFYVITRYNTSKLYAMAAAQLAEAIKKAYSQT